MLSRPMIRCLIRAIRYGRILHGDQAQTWLFPGDSESGQIAEQKEDRSKLSKWGNELRQTYRTIGQLAGISKLDIHLLMNHAIVGTNEEYITRDKLLNDLLRKQQERLSILIVSCAPVDDIKVSAWLKSARDPYRALVQLLAIYRRQNQIIPIISFERHVGTQQSQVFQCPVPAVEKGSPPEPYITSLANHARKILASIGDYGLPYAQTNARQGMTGPPDYWPVRRTHLHASACFEDLNTITRLVAT